MIYLKIILFIAYLTGSAFCANQFQQQVPEEHLRIFSQPHFMQAHSALWSLVSNPNLSTDEAITLYKNIIEPLSPEEAAFLITMMRVYPNAETFPQCAIQNLHVKLAEEMMLTAASPSLSCAYSQQGVMLAHTVLAALKKCVDHPTQRAYYNRVTGELCEFFNTFLVPYLPDICRITSTMGYDFDIYALYQALGLENNIIIRTNIGQHFRDMQTEYFEPAFYIASPEATATLEHLFYLIRTQTIERDLFLAYRDATRHLTQQKKKLLVLLARDALHGRSLPHLALAKLHISLAEALIRDALDQNQSLILAVDCYGKTIAHTALDALWEAVMVLASNHNMKTFQHVFWDNNLKHLSNFFKEFIAPHQQAINNVVRPELNLTTYFYTRGLNLNEYVAQEIGTLLDNRPLPTLPLRTLAEQKNMLLAELKEMLALDFKHSIECTLLKIFRQQEHCNDAVFMQAVITELAQPYYKYNNFFQFFAFLYAQQDIITILHQLSQIVPRQLFLELTSLHYDGILARETLIRFCLFEQISQAELQHIKQLAEQKKTVRLNLNLNNVV